MAAPTGPTRALWLYHSRGDRHSKIACWAILFDLLQHCPVLREHIAEGRVGFGINHEMRDFKENRKKNLDLVLCVPNGGHSPKLPTAFAGLVERYSIVLTAEEKGLLEALPPLPQTPVGAVQVALQSKACMTSHSSAGRRLFDELDSWQTLVRQMQPQALRAAVVLVNSATTFHSPGRTFPVRHTQPRAANYAVSAMSRMPRCEAAGNDGFDALGVLVVECTNDGISPVQHVTARPAPQPGEPGGYGDMIWQLAGRVEQRLAVGCT